MHVELAIPAVRHFIKTQPLQRSSQKPALAQHPAASSSSSSQRQHRNSGAFSHPPTIPPFISNSHLYSHTIALSFLYPPPPLFTRPPSPFLSLSPQQLAPTLPECVLQLFSFSSSIACFKIIVLCCSRLHVVRVADVGQQKQQLLIDILQRCGVAVATRSVQVCSTLRPGWSTLSDS